MSEPTEHATSEPVFSGKDLGLELEKQAEVDNLSGDLLREYYQSFRLSQGATAVQEALFKLLSYQHSLNQHEGIMKDALEQAGENVQKLSPPTRHTGTSPSTLNDPETGFSAMWDKYKVALNNPDPKHAHPTEVILDDFMERELYYQQKPRPNRAEGDDPYESIVREYIFGDKLTGSYELKDVVLELRAAFFNPKNEGEEGSNLSQQLQVLATAWERHHPGQEFFSNIIVN
jgi:hypothetical protein